MVSELISKVADIDAADRQDIEDFLLGGAKPLAIHKELPHIPTKLIRSIAAGMKVRGELNADEEEETPPPVRAIPPVIPTDPLTAQLNAQLHAEMHQEMLYMQLENLKEQRAHRKRMNEIEIDERLQTLAERRARAREEFGEYEDEEDEPAEVDPNSISAQKGYDFERNPFGSLMAFLTDLKKKNDSPQTTMTPHTIDATKPVTDAQIQEIIKATPKTTLMMMKAASDEQLKNGLKQQFPGITDENLIKAITQIRHYEVG